MRDPQYALEKKTSKLAAAQTQKKTSTKPSSPEAVLERLLERNL
jgi:hypothetical protein